MHGGQPVGLTIQTVDGGGNAMKLRAPIVWAPTNDYGVPIADVWTLSMMYAPVAKVDAGGQPLWLVPASDPTAPGGGNTTFQAQKIQFDGARAYPNSTEFHPVLAEADLAVESIRHLVGDDTVATFQYAQAYVDFDLGGSDNPREVFLALKDASQPLAASFAAQADKLGSFVTPSFDIRGLARGAGPVSEIDADKVASAIGDPAALFTSGNPLDVLNAKLFGCMSLSEVIGKNLSFDSIAPKFVADAMHEVDRYRTMLADVQAKLDGLATQLAAVGTSGIPSDVQATVSAFVTQAEQDALAAKNAAVAAVTEILAAPGKVAGGTDPDDERNTLDGLIDAFTGAVQSLPALWTSSKELPYVYPLVPGLEVALRQVTSILQRAVEIAEDVKGMLDKFLRGVELVKCGQVTIDWTPPLSPWPSATDAIFVPTRPLVLKATIRTKQVGDAKPGVDLLCALEKFDLVLAGQRPYVTLHFDKLQFRKQSGKKPEVDVVFNGLEFKGPLAFIQTIKNILPLDGFSDPPGIDVSPTGIVASYSMGLPSIAVGMFSLENMAISASLDVPFIGDSMALRFAFCSRERPFTLTVCGLGGTGFFALEVTPKGVTALEAQLEFGARVSINLGVASGSVSVMGGVYFGWFQPQIKLTGFVRIRGEVSVLDLISASIELYMGLEYRTDSGDFSKGKVVGRAYLEIEVSIAFFSKKVHIEVERKLAGAAGDPSFQDTTTQTDWNTYCAAFAA
jgi:hypothetical protein